MTRILITSALPYINGVKHLGNLVGSMLPADVYARWARSRGHEVLALCATDEHGTPAELAAEAAGMPVAAFCDQAYALQRDLGERFGLSWDWFGRSSRRQNHELTQHFAEVLEKNGLIDEREENQIYSAADGRFLPDRFVEGTCPNCGYDRARGDQCENCGKLLDPTDLLDPRSAVSGAKDLVVRPTRHLYLKQSDMQERLRAWIDSQSEWPRLVTSIAYKWLDEGLRDRAITRDLSWGVAVVKDGKPRPGFENKVFYVWFDAPIAYIAAAKEWSDAGHGDWRPWWRTDAGADDVRYVQFMAKDNVPFHTVGFPITLLGSEEPWKTANVIKGFNWLTWYGGKFSTSQKRGVFMDQALELLPADYWRWWLMANAPEGDDASFTWERFQEQCNKDLADVLGNFVNRVCRFTASKFGATIPTGGEVRAVPGYDALVARLGQAVADYDGHMAGLNFRLAAAELRGIWALANEFVTEAAPWTLFKTEPDKAGAALRVCFNLIEVIGFLSRPFIPFTAARLEEVSRHTAPPLTWPVPQANAADLAAWGESMLTRIPGGVGFEGPGVLFQKISDEAVAEWAERFGGA
jgi:methionyl-tRNA synthetase